MKNITHRVVNDRFSRFPRRANTAQRFDPRREPTLAEILDDPIIQTLMKRDGVRREEVERLAFAAGQ